uniref:CASP-like protein n=1 Tax=Aegilops tauschii subsp. strangulata TaxID=200361 RepID=A0A453ASB2_AEGTS
MAVGRRLELLVLSSTADSFLLVLEVVFVVCCLEDPYQPSFRLPNQLMWWALMCGAFPWSAVLLALQMKWLSSEGWEPTNVELLVLIAVEWVVACSTFGSACAALAVDQLAIQHSYCHPEATVCLTYLVAVATACAAGALAAMSALGMLWILASRFRPAHAA